VKYVVLVSDVFKHSMLNCKAAVTATVAQSDNASASQLLEDRLRNEKEKTFGCEKTLWNVER
jgi:hypothetical protein